MVCRSQPARPPWRAGRAGHGNAAREHHGPRPPPPSAPFQLWLPDEAGVLRRLHVRDLSRHLWGDGVPVLRGGHQDAGRFCDLHDDGHAGPRSQAQHGVVVLERQLGGNRGPGPGQLDRRASVGFCVGGACGEGGGGGAVWRGAARRARGGAASPHRPRPPPTPATEIFPRSTGPRSRGSSRQHTWNRGGAARRTSSCRRRRRRRRPIPARHRHRRPRPGPRPRMRC